jgi:hypothetical protein
MAAHNHLGGGARDHIPALLGAGVQGLRVVGDESLHRGGRARGRRCSAEQLGVGGQKPLAGVGARQEVRVRSRGGDREDLHRCAVGTPAGFGSGQPVEWVPVRRNVGAVVVEEPKHVVERPILQHQHHNVIDTRQPHDHRQSPLLDACM